MDLLYQRYASPFSFIDGAIQAGRFAEFVVEIWNTAQKEKDEQTLWEYYLHKVWEGSFEDFKEGLRQDIANQNMSEHSIEATVKNSLEILGAFTPKERGD